MSQPKPLILSCRGHAPQIDETCWLAPNATVVGQVSLGFTYIFDTSSGATVYTGGENVVDMVRAKLGM